jgi:hypothetical protein
MTINASGSASTMNWVPHPFAFVAKGWEQAPQLPANLGNSIA